MKHTFLFIIIVTLLFSSVACASDEVYKSDETTFTTAETERVYVERFGFSEITMASSIADLNTIEAVTELSSQVVICEILSLDKNFFTETGSLSFEYSVEIKEILFDVNDRLSVGDVIGISTSEGIIPASTAAELLKDDERAKKLGILQEDSYAANEYIISSQWDAIPIEIGKTYLMYLTDAYLEKDHLYAESGRQFLYEIDGESIYSSGKMTKESRSYEKLIADIKKHLNARTGRADEIGRNDYIFELGQQQAAERASQHEENATSQ